MFAPRLTGSAHQGSDLFSDDSRGRQCTAISFVSLFYGRLRNPSNWSREDLDFTLCIGDKMYSCVNKHMYDCKGIYLLHDDAFRIFNEMGVSPYSSEQCRVRLLNSFQGSINRDIADAEFRSAVAHALNLSDCCLVTVGEKTFSLFRNVSARQLERFFVFDSHDYDFSEKCALFCFTNLDDVILFFHNCFVNRELPFDISSFKLENVTYYSMCSFLKFLHCKDSFGHTLDPFLDLIDARFLHNINDCCKLFIYGTNVIPGQNDKLKTRLEDKNRQIDDIEIINELAQNTTNFRLKRKSAVNDILNDDNDIAKRRRDEFYISGNNFGKNVLSEHNYFEITLNDLTSENGAKVCNINISSERVNDANHERRNDTKNEKNSVKSNLQLVGSYNRTKGTRRYYEDISALPSTKCSICERFLFEEQVYYLKSKLSIDTNYNDNKRPVCFTCGRAFQRRRTIARAVTNKLRVSKVPDELRVLNFIERRFVSKLQLYITLVILKGGQYAQNGFAIYFPSEPKEQIDKNLPTNWRIQDIIYSNDYGSLQRSIHPKRIIEALKWLKNNNPYFSSINLPSECLTDPEAQNDESMLENVNECSVTNIDSYASSKNRRELIATFKKPILNEKPVNYTDYEGVETKAFPWLFPFGKNEWTTKRALKLSLLQYYQQRLYNFNPIFRTDISYLIAACNEVERRYMFSCLKICARVQKTFQTNGNESGFESLRARDLQQSNPPHLYHNSYTFMKNIRGTAAYWKNQLFDLLARVKTLGPPDLFLTFSADDCHWPELQAVLANDFQRLEGNVTKATNFVRKNPLITALYFQRRWQTLLRNVILADDNLFGKVQDHYGRIEFQNRGSPHMHLFLWIPDAPNMSKNSTVNDIINYIDNIICTQVPNDDSDLRELVTSRQVHHHTFGCQKKDKSCRFHFPRQVCDKSKIKIEDERRGNSTFYDTRRPAGSEWINAFNRTLLKKWRANMDIQMVNGIDGLAYYVCKYACKAEPEDLKLLLRETIDKLDSEGVVDATRRLAKIGMCVLKHRRLSAQEAAFRIGHMPLIYSSRQVVFVPTTFPDKRYRILKKKTEIDELDPESENVFQNDLLTLYRTRPQSLEEISFLDFCSWYKSGKGSKKNPSLKTLTGVHITKRNKFVCIRTSYLPINSEEYYYSLLLLNRWHRRENELLIPYVSYKCCFLACYDSMNTFESRENMQTELLAAMHRLRAEVQADLLAETLDDQYIYALEMDAVDLADFTDCNMEDVQATHHEVNSCRRDANADHLWHQLNSNAPQIDIAQAIKTMTVDQKLFLQIIFNKVQKKTPFAYYLTGSAGTGKSHLLKFLISWLSHFVYDLSGTNSVLVCAPTGVAAKQIGGVTIHYAFGLKAQHGREPEQLALTGLKLQKLTNRMRYIKFIIIDEVSMVSAKVLEIVNVRLQQLKANKLPYGGLSIIVCGDFHQLEPVRAQFAFTSPEWKNFKPFFLRTNVRQQNDLRFTSLLNNVRIGKLTKDDEALIKSRLIIDEDASVVKNLLHLYPIVSQVEAYNKKKQKEISNAAYTLTATNIYSSRGSKAGQTVKQDKLPLDYRQTVGLMFKLNLSEGSRVIVVKNIGHGLVNGSIGTVRKFKVHNNIVCTVLVEFDDKMSGQPWRDKDLNNCICIDKMTLEYFHRGESIERTQFPLMPAFALTIHKAQGLSLNAAAIYLGKETFAKGQAYVALSRLTSLAGLYIIKFSPSSIRTNNDVIAANNEMLQQFLSSNNVMD